MILTCPACETRYNVADEAVSSAAGRQVRCANCGHVWHFAAALQETLPLGPRRVAGATAGIAPPLPVMGAAVGSGAAEADDADSLLDLGTASTPAVAPQHVRRSLVRLVSLLLVFAALLLLILARNAVVKVLPQAAVVYSALGLGTEGASAGLDLKVTPTRTGEDFVVAAEITNTSDAARAVPRLRVALLDGNRNELDVKFIEPDVNQLAPGAVVRVRAIFAHPSITASDVEVTFAAE
jgi:predicted Zn finger-like uncharacterized protein